MKPPDHRARRFITSTIQFSFILTHTEQKAAINRALPLKELTVAMAEQLAFV